MFFGWFEIQMIPKGKYNPKLYTFIVIFQNNIYLFHGPPLPTNGEKCVFFVVHNTMWLEVGCQSVCERSLWCPGGHRAKQHALAMSTGQNPFLAKTPAFLDF